MQRLLVNDFGTGNLAALAILLGLYHRMRTGEGQFVGASLAQTSTLHQLPFMLHHQGRIWDEPAGQEAKGWSPLYRLYKAADRWFFLAAVGKDALQRLSKVTGLEGLDGLATDALEAALCERFETAVAASWVEPLQDAGLGAHVLADFYVETMEDAWVKAHGLSMVRHFPAAGLIRTVGPASRLSLTPVKALPPAEPAGTHGREILRELGFSERVEMLLATGVVREPDAAPASAR